MFDFRILQVSAHFKILRCLIAFLVEYFLNGNGINQTEIVEDGAPSLPELKKLLLAELLKFFPELKDSRGFYKIRNTKFPGRFTDSNKLNLFKQGRKSESV